MRSRTGPLLAVSAAAAGGFALLARAVARRETSDQDDRVRRQVPKPRRGATRKAVAGATGPIGKEWVHAPVALATAAWMWRRGTGVRPAAVPVLASAASEALNRVCSTKLRHRPPPPGRHDPMNPSFPSGHSLETAAVALATAHVLTREGLVSPRVALPVALVVPLLSGAGRLSLDRHWGTDVLGGWLLGVSVAATCAALYELTAPVSPRRRRWRRRFR